MRGTDAALKGQYELAILIALAVAKTAATAICLGCGFGGGIFSPSLFIGAMVGGAFGIIATQTFPELSSGISVYTLVGLGAVAGAVLGAPISTILIVFELTANYALTIVVMVAVVIASVIAQQMKSQSFFRWQLARRNVDLEAGHDEISSTIVSEATRRDHTVIGTEDGLEDLREALLAAPCNEVFVVDADGKLQGSIHVDVLADLTGSELERAADVMRTVAATVQLEDSLDDALTVMERQGVEHAAVIEKDNQLAGYLRKIDPGSCLQRGSLSRPAGEKEAACSAGLNSLNLNSDWRVKILLLPGRVISGC